MIIDDFLEQMHGENKQKVLFEAKVIANNIEDETHCEQFRQLIFFLENGRRPMGIDLDCFNKFYKIAQDLVERSELPPAVLEEFSK